MINALSEVLCSIVVYRTYPKRIQKLVWRRFDFIAAEVMEIYCLSVGSHFCVSFVGL